MKKAFPGRVYLFVFFFLSSVLLFSQKQYNVWYFGTNNALDNALPGAGLDFNPNPPQALFNSAMNFTEGCASICDSSTGQLLFYTNGDTIWDRTHQIMSNGAGISDWRILSSTQSAVITPKPGDANKYYVFCNAGAPTGGGTGVYYSVVDMNLNAGLGGVTIQKAIPLLSQTTSEKMTAVRHANGTDFWIITNLIISNTYYAYHVSAAGVSAPVITSIGPVDTYGGVHHLKASPKRDKLATDFWTNDPITGGTETGFFCFNNASGVLSNYIKIQDSSEGFGTGLSFSPDGNLLYLALGEEPQPVYQYDMNSIDPKSTKTQVGTVQGEGYLGDGIAYDIQIAPDGKLYFSIPATYISPVILSQSRVDVIQSPNVKGPGCGFISRAISLGSDRTGWYSFPNVITDYLYKDTVTFIPPVADLGNDTLLCSGESLILGEKNQGNMYYWSTGETTQSISVTAEGTYAVAINPGCPAATDNVAVEYKNCDIGSLYIPGSFTPNGDGKNDVFFVYGNNVSQFSMVIYNRWGGKVFETHDILEGWDGNNNAYESVYICSVEGDVLGEGKVSLMQRVTLIR